MPAYTLTGTVDHPFFVPVRGQYVPMAELGVGDGLMGQEGNRAVVVGVEVRYARAVVFNMEVGGVHDYLINTTSDGVLVHNNVCDKIQNVINSLPADLFQRYRCKECARAIESALKASSLSGRVLTIEARNGGYIISDLVGGGTPITTNGEHIVVEIEGYIFDNFFRQGIPTETYIRSLHSLDGITIKTRKF